MTTSPTDAPGAGAAVLRRLRAPAAPRPERCAFCGTALAPEHRHLADTAQRALACACPACAMLFDRPGAAGGRYRGVPRRYLVDPAHGVDDADWEALQIPVSTVFFLRNSALDRLVALYPSPAGPAESELDPSTWQAVLDRTRLAALLEPDVEALLLRRAGGVTTCHLVPVDACYELVGRMRLHWQGFDGGQTARAELEGFFDRLAGLARPLTEDTA
ncbi:DUF5947 family protein [Kitasatospora sp. NPDC093679]|uniref:DUF5947 family protein n=1 Tax=Kitasatospora sp. NPDC093679 TaxID=3154983 RepID=UPI00341C75A2